MAYQKVMIAGLDTSRLTVLTEAEKIALLREYRENGNEQAREKLILGNLRLVLSVIQRFTGRGEEIDDAARLVERPFDTDAYFKIVSVNRFRGPDRRALIVLNGEREKVRGVERKRRIVENDGETDVGTG